MPGPAFRSVRGRMLFWIVAVTLPIYAGALYMSYHASARRLEAGAARDVDALTARLAAGVDAVIRPIEGGIRTVAYQLEEIDPPQADYSPRIMGILKAWPDVYGSTIAVEAGRDTKTRRFAPYFFRRAGGFGFSDLAHAKYAYQQLPWYRRAADSAQPTWSQPYFDAGGGDIWMVTYSVPFFRWRSESQRDLAGVVTADLALDWVKKTAADAALGPVGMGWLLSPQARDPFVAPIGSTDRRVQQFDPAMSPAAIRDIGERMMAQKETIGRLPEGITAKPAYLAVRRLDTLDWRVMLVIPRAELLAEANDVLTRQLWLGAAGLVLLAVAILVVAAGITRPIRALADAVGQAREDDLEWPLPDAPRRDEIGVLTEALRRMRGALSQHVALRAATLAEQARAEHDLHIAATIQQSMLPKPGADVPPGVQVAAALLPAQQVGGDLYDYFAVDDGHLLFAVGDVSDKGVPAALFMARLSALLRLKGASGVLLEAMFSRINARLSEGNDACMFATLGCGLLNVNTGRIRYVSAGHEPPLVRNVEGDVRFLAVENGPAIGMELTAEYLPHEGRMAPGDTLVLFTDGVTEAEAKDGSMYGVERLSDLLRDSGDDDPAAVVQRVVDTVAAHASGFHATDDLTVLVVRWNPEGVTAARIGDAMRWHMQVEAFDGGIRQLQDWLTAILAARGVPAGRIAEAELIAEELLTNVARATGPSGRPTRISVACMLTPSWIELRFRDDGTPFDPLSRASPNLDADIADRDVGGLGIFLVQRLAQRCTYSRTDGWNVLDVHLARHA